MGTTRFVFSFSAVLWLAACGPVDFEMATTERRSAELVRDQLTEIAVVVDYQPPRGATDHAAKVSMIADATEGAVLLDGHEVLLAWVPLECGPVTCSGEFVVDLELHGAELAVVDVSIEVTALSVVPYGAADQASLEVFVY